MNVFSIIKLVVIILAAAIFITASLSLMTSSYAEWAEYYNNAMAEKENQKYLESLPLTYEGLSASLKDGVVFYASGKANITKEDIEVVAHFSEKGKYTDKILDTSDFEIEVPDGFSSVGGTIIVKYLYQPEKAEGATEEPAPILRSTEIKVDLVPIQVASLEIVTAPYRVYYKEGMSFDLSGVELVAVLNCGDTVSLDESNITVINGKNLKAGTESVKIAFDNDGVTVESAIPVTVKSASEYQDGRIVSLAIEGDIYATDGQKLSEVGAKVRATYENGNRLLISSDEYTVTGNIDNASLASKCNVSIALKSNSSVSCTAPVIVRYSVEAENASVEGGRTSTITLGGKTVTIVEGLANGNKMTFGISSTVNAKVALTLRLANNAAKAINPADVIEIKINGRVYLVPCAELIPAKSTNSGYDFLDLALPAAVLNVGDNVVEITFIGSNASSLAIDALNVETEINDALTFGEYLVSAKDKDASATVTATAKPTTGDSGKIVVNVGKAGGQLYSMGGVSDGQYIYVSMNAKNNIATVISKIDPLTNNVVAQTESFVPGAEKIDNSRIFILGDTLYCIIQDGSMVEINLKEFNSFGYKVKKSTLSFADLGTAYDATWNESIGKICVITKENTINILNDDLVSTKGNLSITNPTSGANSVASDDKYIYIGYMNGLQYIIDVYTWDGVKVDTVNVSGFALGSETKFNVQAIYVHNGELHAAVCAWGTTYKEAFFDFTIKAD